MFLKLFLWLPLLCSGCFAQLSVGDNCRSADGVEGICKIVLLCDPAVKQIRKQEYHTFKRCGFAGLDEIVCCIEGAGFGDRNAVPTTEPPAMSTRPLPARGMPQSSTRPVKAAAATLKPLRKADRECERMKEMVLPPLTSHIIGGEEASAAEFPHMVQVGYLDEDKESKDKGIMFLCGGTLVSERYIMSAAHCFNERRLVTRKPVLVRAGVTSLAGNSYNPQTDYNISRVLLHPKFSRHSFDIALVEYFPAGVMDTESNMAFGRVTGIAHRLARPVPVTESAHPGCLYTRDELPAHATVTGWGVIDYESHVYSETLQKVNLTVVEQASCKREYAARGVSQVIEDNMLCAGSEKGKDACQGDSGGPLQALTEKDGHYRIIGIVSFGVLCGTQMPGVYTRVSSHLDWIESVVWP